MSLRYDQTWFAPGVKIGGMAVLGAESFQGCATRVDGFDTWQEVNVTSLRLGLGLGGSIGISLFCAFNCPTLYSVNGKFVSDWGINIALPGVKANAKGLGTALNLATYLDQAGRAFLVKPFIRSLSPEKISKIRDWMSLVYNSADGGAKMAVANGEPWVTVLDLPIGTGAEVSAYFTGGEVSVGGYITG